MAQQKVTKALFLIFLFGSINVNTICITLTWTGLLTKAYSFTYLLAIIISTLHYLFASGILLWIFLKTYNSDEDTIEAIGTNIARLELLSVFVLFFIQVFHVLTISEWIQKDDQSQSINVRLLNIQLTTLAAVFTLIVIFLVLSAFFVYSCHSLRCMRRRKGASKTYDEVPHSINTVPVDQSLKQLMGDKSVESDN